MRVALDDLRLLGKFSRRYSNRSVTKPMGQTKLSDKRGLQINNVSPGSVRHGEGMKDGFMKRGIEFDIVQPPHREL